MGLAATVAYDVASQLKGVALQLRLLQHIWGHAYSKHSMPALLVQS